MFKELMEDWQAEASGAAGALGRCVIADKNMIRAWPHAKLEGRLLYEHLSSLEEYEHVT